MPVDAARVGLTRGHTMAIRQITPADAHALLGANPRAIYVDVRTVDEFTAGHPVDAVNIPLVLFEPGRPGPLPNPHFIGVIEAHYPKETPLVLGCQMGGRSQRAAELLEAAGFTDLSNVQGGFGGLREPGGRLITPGWRDAGLPVDTGNGPGQSYDSLRAKIGR
jgi:rhodanese-related sulfurtransferase